MLADWIEGKRLDKYAEDTDLIFCGDCNIESITDDTFKAITRHGLRIPDALISTDPGSDLQRKKRYDQILHYPQYPENFTNAGGILDFFIDDAHIKELFPEHLSHQQFTYELSDHLVLWMQINTDLETQRLDQVIQSSRRPEPSLRSSRSSSSRRHPEVAHSR